MIGDDANPVTAKTAAHALDNRQKRGHARRVTGPHPGADGCSAAIDDKAEDHLLEAGALIDMFAQGLAAFAVKREAAGIHEQGRRGQ